MNYHAHIYSCAYEKNEAAELHTHLLTSEFLKKTFPGLTIGTFHDKPVGPHSTGQFQLAFDDRIFEKVIRWLMVSKGNLSALIHPLTGNELKDHTEHAIWLGHKQALYLSKLSNENE